MDNSQRQGTESFTSFQTSNHYHNNRDSPAFPFTNLTNRTRYIMYRLIAPTTTVTVAILGGDFVMPFNGNFIINGVTLSSVGATVDTAGTTGNMTIDVLLNGTSIFLQTVSPTKITVASGAKTSRGNTSQPLIGYIVNNVTLNSFNRGDILTFSVATIQTTPSLGLTMFLKVIETSP